MDYTRKLFLFSILFILSFSSFSQARHTFEIKDGEFFFDNKAIKIHSGEMHFARVPAPYWRQRLRMIRAMGLNAVCTYVFWNYHETAPGVWDFKTESHNIREFIKIAGEEGLMVILRPGPYACAEWEFGGYPWWLQKNKSLVIRAYNEAFLDSCKIYINRLGAQVRDLQITHGGPVIMVQVENEFGSYVAQQKSIPIDNHKKYIKAIQQQLIDAGFDIPFFTSDGSSLFAGGSISGALPMANGETNIDNLKKAVNDYHDGKGPYMVAEYYPGWLDHWGEPFEEVDTKNVLSDIEKYLKEGVSFNFYMVHGGTNFGFTSGANYDKEHDIQPDITSYDYDAPISEAGWSTPKFDSLRELFGRYGAQLPSVPPAPPVIKFPAVTFNRSLDLFSLTDKMNPIVNNSPQTFEELNQGVGWVLYSRTFSEGMSGILELKGLRDYAIIYVNRKRIAELNRNINAYECKIDIPVGGKLDILVENMGRINYGAEIVHNLKGIISPVMINGETITGNWKMFKLPMTVEPSLRSNATHYASELPMIYQASFNVEKPGDSFLNMQAWGKGIVFVNGHNLGRYWKIGPQQTLFLPGCWLIKGKNRITVFEEMNDEKHDEIDFVERPMLKKLGK